MISVCYLSPSRRRRARSRWCWAPAPGGCWMWLGREQKTTKTTAWCTAKVSKQRRHPVISLRGATHHAMARHSNSAKTLTMLHPLLSCPSSPSVFGFLSLFLLFFLPQCFSKSQTHTNDCSSKDTQKDTRTQASLAPYLFYSKESFISLKLWLGTEKHHLTHKVNGL